MSKEIADLKKEKEKSLEENRQLKGKVLNLQETTKKLTVESDNKIQKIQQLNISLE